MLLDRIDIDAHGPLNRVELGPFSESLNVVLSPEGSGKTAIIRFIRDSLVNRDYPIGMMSSSTGRIVWADGYGKVHCRREQDGTSSGRRTVEFESRGDFETNYHQLRHSWIGGITRSSDAAQSAQSLNLPESIVDGVITDSSVTSVARVVSACVRSGLDDWQNYNALPIDSEKSYGNREQLRAQLADIDAEIARIEQSGIEANRLAQRRHELELRLGEFRSKIGSNRTDSQQHQRLNLRLKDLYNKVTGLRQTESELRRWIAELERNVLPTSGIQSKAEYLSESKYGAYLKSLDQDLQRRLSDLDLQIIHWRRTLMEVRGLKELLLSKDTIGYSSGGFSHYASEPNQHSTWQPGLDGFISAIDRYHQFNDWRDFYQNGYLAGSRTEDIELRIESAARRIDWLLERYGRADGLYADWYRSAENNHAYFANRTLSETLGAIREDLRVVRTRFESGSLPATASIQNQRDAFDLVELNRSENWLISTLDQLTEYRNQLFRGRLPQDVAASNEWTHWHLARYERERAESVAELRRVERELERCLNEAAETRNATRQLPVKSDWYDKETRADWRDRDAILEEIRRIDDLLASHGRLHSLSIRKQEILRQLGATRVRPESNSPLAEEASRWLVRLSAGRLRRVDWPYAAFRQMRAAGGHYSSNPTGLTDVRIDGRDEIHCAAADRAVAALAVRMAAVDLLARTGRSVPLVVETHRELLQTPACFTEYAANDWGQIPSYWGNESGRAWNNITGGLRSSEIAYRDYSYDGRSNHAIAAALHDFVRSGRQVVLLTSSPNLNDQLQRVGARSFEIHANRIVHPHRPMWRPQYESEKYVGPHAHTYGSELAPDFRAVDYGHEYVQLGPDAKDYRASLSPQLHSEFPRYQPNEIPSGRAEFNSSPRSQSFASSSYPPNASSMDVNRHFDTAWREAYGFYDNPEVFRNHTMPPTDWATDGIPFRDGYYFTESFTTAPTDFAANGAREQLLGEQSATHNASSNQLSANTISKRKRKTPFFLSVDSPIDQAPSVDAVAAARLRGLKVSHINHLMQQDPNRLSDALGLANVDAETIRQWQSECRLVSRVPHLRGFDARILVGCGVTDPAQLSAIHPADLLERVESFLATESGQKILMSGTSYELSRITSWIASANASSPERGRFGRYDERTVDGRVLRGSEPRYEYDSDRYEYDVVADGDLSTGGRRRKRRNIRTVADGPRLYDSDSGSQTTNDSSYDGAGYGSGRGYGSRRGFGQGSRNGNGYSSRSTSGRRSRSATGSGQGNGTSNRNSGRGTGSGTGQGSGRATGIGNGSGQSSNRSSGYGSGSGYGTGSGRGNGNRSGRSSSRSNRRANGTDAGRSSNRATSSGRSQRQSREYEPREYDRSERTTEPRSYDSTTYDRSNRNDELSERAPREYDREPRDYDREPREPREPRSERGSYESNRSSSSREERSSDSERELRFYLQRDSPVVDAPSIGSRMASRLEQAGIFTVQDLIKADPEALAESIDHRRVNAAVITTWQQQATLQCRIPMLRGHDAQLLVAAEVTTPEEVAAYNAEELLSLIIPIAKSSEGKRILRGGKMPDLDEMNDWINYAGQSRELMAA